MIINKEVIAGKMAEAMADVKAMTNFPHDLNDHIRGKCAKYFIAPESDLVEVGVVMMYLQQSEEFIASLDGDIPKHMKRIFSGIFIRRLCELPGVKTEWNALLAACPAK